MMAAKNGADPDMNFKLRFEIDKAREASMPKENIERAIAKATTEAANLTEVTYEGFGPGGIGFIVQAATDNKNRAAQEVKNIFDRAGGTLAGPGAVSFNFEPKGFILVKKKGDVEAQMLSLIDLGAEDIQETEDGLEIYVSPEHLSETHKKLDAAGFAPTRTELIMEAKNPQAVSDVSMATKVIKLIDNLEEMEDVQKVFTNMDIPEEIAKQIQ